MGLCPSTRVHARGKGSDSCTRVPVYTDRRVRLGQVRVGLGLVRLGTLGYAGSDLGTRVQTWVRGFRLGYAGVQTWVRRFRLVYPGSDLRTRVRIRARTLGLAYAG